MKIVTPPVAIEFPGFRGETEVRIGLTTATTQEADLAEKLMRQLAIAMGEVDGEDSAGRQKLRLMTPAEVAQRACDIAQAAFEQFRARDWLIAIPTPTPPRLKDSL